MAAAGTVLGDKMIMLIDSKARRSARSLADGSLMPGFPSKMEAFCTLTTHFVEPRPILSVAA
jgi:hypothetical protein